MTKRRARLNDDNDPLSSTDKVLAGFEQISNSTSQQDEVSTSQEADKLTNQPEKLPTSQEADKPKSQQDEVSTSQEADKSTRQQSKSEYTFDASTSQPDSTPIIQPNSNSTSEKANLLTSQQVNVEKVSLRKSTFQISEEVLHQLDKLHLTLQLELGKAHAPFKEVIVEEALVQLLESFNSDRAALIEVLMSRQKSRDKL
jgi:cobalamin biosynthesis protein CobT